MPSGNQARSAHQGRQNGGADQGRLSERAHQAGEQLREGLDTARDAMGQRYRMAERRVVENPTASVLLGLGIGFGLGLAITTMLGEREHSTWTDRHVPDRFRRWPDSLHAVADQLADSVHSLRETVRSHLPSTLTRH